MIRCYNSKISNKKQGSKILLADYKINKMQLKNKSIRYARKSVSRNEWLTNVGLREMKKSSKRSWTRAKVEWPV